MRAKTGTLADHETVESPERGGCTPDLRRRTETGTPPDSASASDSAVTNSRSRRSLASAARCVFYITFPHWTIGVHKQHIPSAWTPHDQGNHMQPNCRREPKQQKYEHQGQQHDQQRHPGDRSPRSLVANFSSLVVGHEKNSSDRVHLTIPSERSERPRGGTMLGNVDQLASMF